MEIRPTQPLTPREYFGNTNLPKYRTMEEILLARVQKESAVLDDIITYEMPEYELVEIKVPLWSKWVKFKNFVLP